jgi:hypothetical protein
LGLIPAFPTAIAAPPAKTKQNKASQSILSMHFNFLKQSEKNRSVDHPVKNKFYANLRGFCCRSFLMLAKKKCLNQLLCWKVFAPLVLRFLHLKGEGVLQMADERGKKASVGIATFLLPHLLLPHHSPAFYAEVNIWANALEAHLSSLKVDTCVLLLEPTWIFQN